MPYIPRVHGVDWAAGRVLVDGEPSSLLARLRLSLPVTDDIQGSTRGSEGAKALAVLLLAFLPIGTCLAYKAFVAPRPFWIHYYDPEMAYYHGSRQLLTGEVPVELAHPGTPLYILGAGLLVATGQEPSGVPTFLWVGYTVAFALSALAGLRLLRHVLGDLPVLLQVSALWTYFICPQSLEYLTVWSPEILFFALGAVTLTSLWDLGDRGGSARQCLVAGALIGVCCGLKLVFLAWAAAYIGALLLAPFDATRSRIPAAAAGALGVACGFVAATAIVLPGYPRIFTLLLGLATHSGDYATGPAGPPGIGLFVRNWADEFWTAKGWSLWLVALVGLMLVSVVQPKSGAGGERRGRRFIAAFLLLACAGTYLLSGRQAGLRYLLPAGVCGVLAFRLSMEPLLTLARSRLVSLCVCTVAAVLLGKHIGQDLTSHHNRIAEGSCFRQRVQMAVRRASSHRDAVVLFSYRLPMPSFALRGSAPDARFLGEVEGIYPEEGSYSVFSRQLFPPAGRPVWEVLVLDEAYVDAFPLPLARAVDRVGNYLVFRNVAASSNRHAP
jgi:hypothetical protein